MSPPNESGFNRSRSPARERRHHRGVLSTELIERLNGAARDVEAGLPTALGAERARLTRLHEGLRTARDVLEAARDALREGSL